jgi:phenylacetic acid degradation operon negative regulatory protein
MVSKINARSLVLDLLFADVDSTLSIKQLLLAGELFCISGNSIRVAITRLSNDQMLESAARGMYRLSSNAKDKVKQLAYRADSIHFSKTWSGHYLAIHTGALGRVDRTALSVREKLLHLNGFRELQTDLFIRPDNLSESLAEIRERFIAAGFDARALFFIIKEVDHHYQQAVNELWDSESLNQKYKKMSSHIQAWLSRYDELELDVALRESLLIGREVIPQMKHDPLLPEPLINKQLQTAFFEDVQLLDQTGQRLWKRFMESHMHDEP